MGLQDDLRSAVDGEQIPFLERTEAAHLQFLTEFNTKVWPALQTTGFSKDTLLLYWILVRVENAVSELVAQQEN